MIELHWLSSGEKFLVNSHYIVTVAQRVSKCEDTYGEVQTRVTMLGADSSWFVRESYEEVKALLCK